MKNLVIIYWSGTGNTEAMAKAVEEGAKAAGASVKLLEVDEATLDDAKNADVLLMGCPSMGSEVLEEGSMEPFVESLEGNVDGKPVALFGSYGWGNGEWMEDWEERMQTYGANIVADSLIINETPDEAGLADCKALGEAAAKA